MAEGNKVIVETVDDISFITLNNPDRRNAISPEMRDELITALLGLNDDRSTRAIVITGAEGNFCAGGDISSMDQDEASANLLSYRRRMERYHDAARAIVHSVKPVVAAVEGNAFGAGMSIALACDHVVAAEDARFCCAFARVGLMPDMGLMWTLPQRVGMTKARELMTLATVVRAPEALALGMINEIAEPADTRSRAAAAARNYARVAPASFSLIKAAFADGSVNTLEGAFQAESSNQAALRTTADHRDAVAAFLAKREVTFRGR